MDNNASDESSSDKPSEAVENDEVVLSSYIATNSEVFPRVLQLHVEDGAKIADVTYGKGVFWEEMTDNKPLYRR